MTVQLIHYLIYSPVVGTSLLSNLCAAGPRLHVPKSVFCVSNLNKKCSEKDIKDHCKKIKVRVLFCYDVSNPELDAKAFKLAVPEIESSLILDPASWPRYVTIRHWGSGSAKPLQRGEDIVQNSSKVIRLHSDDTPQIVVEHQDELMSESHFREMDSSTHV